MGIMSGEVHELHGPQGLCAPSSPLLLRPLQGSVLLQRDDMGEGELCVAMNARGSASSQCVTANVGPTSFSVGGAYEAPSRPNASS